MYSFSPKYTRLYFTLRKSKICDLLRYDGKVGILRSSFVWKKQIYKQQADVSLQFVLLYLWDELYYLYFLLCKLTDAVRICSIIDTAECKCKNENKHCVFLKTRVSSFSLIFPNNTIYHRLGNPDTHFRVAWNYLASEHSLR